jgi:hypothetical protein
MDADPSPSYEELVALTQGQARQLDERRTAVERLKAGTPPSH